jgi:hypothetical protein
MEKIVDLLRSWLNQTEQTSEKQPEHGKAVTTNNDANKPRRS